MPPGLKAGSALRALLTAAILYFFIVVTAFSARAETWPYPAGDIKAEGAIVMDADTLTVLWGRNQDQQYCPASITKLMTALLVMENCSPDDTVQVTSEAISNLESGATNIALREGDELTVEDMLYALLLKSANDVANALAIHVGGSIPEFCAMMNERALELGCKNTDFHNPSGLTDSEHLTTAYDMALIMAACLKTPGFLEIESHDSYTLAPTISYPGGLTVSMGHKMLKSGTGYTDERAIAGKTGYITASGNTLVTAATDGERTVITVCLKDVSPSHYTDTSTLIDFGLGSFDNIILDDVLERFSCYERLKADRIIEGEGNNIFIEEGAVVTLPEGCDDEGIAVSYNYNLGDDAPERACAILTFSYEGRKVGRAYLQNERESMLVLEEEEEGEVKEKAKTAGIFILLILVAAAAVILLGTLSYVKMHAARKEKDRLDRIRLRREERLKSMGLSREDFEDELIRKQEKRRLRSRERPVDGQDG